MTKTINKISFIHQTETEPDLSYIEDPKVQGLDKRSFIFYCLECKRSGLYPDNKTCFYCQSKNIEKRREILKELEHYKQLNKDRLESYGNSWVHIGIYATAEINAAGTIQEIRSAGLWGIESDSDQEYLKQTELEQLEELKDQLKEFGFSKADLNKIKENSIEVIDK